MKSNDRIRNELIKIIRNHHPRLAIKSVGGFKNFKRVMGIDSPSDFLDLFKDMEIVGGHKINHINEIKFMNWWYEG